MAEGRTWKETARRSGSNHSSEYLSISDESLTGENNPKPKNDDKDEKVSAKRYSDWATTLIESNRWMSGIREKHLDAVKTNRQHTSVKAVTRSTVPERGRMSGDTGYLNSTSSLKTSHHSATSNHFQSDEDWDFTGMSTHAFVDTNFRFVTITPSSSLEEQVSPTNQDPLYQNRPSGFDNWTADEKDYLLRVMALALASKAVMTAQEELLVLSGQYPYTLNRKMSNMARDPAIVLPLKKTLFRKFSQKNDRNKDYSSNVSGVKTGWMSAPDKYEKSLPKDNKIERARGIPKNGVPVTTSSRGFVHRGDSLSITDQGINVQFVRKKQTQPFGIPSEISTITTEDSYEAIDDPLCYTKWPKTYARASAVYSDQNQSTISLTRATARTDMVEDQMNLASARTDLVEDQMNLASCSYYLETDLSRPSTSKPEESGSRIKERHGIGSLRIRKSQPKLVPTDSFTERYSLARFSRTSTSTQYDTSNEIIEKERKYLRHRNIVESKRSSHADVYGNNRGQPIERVDNEPVYRSEDLDEDTNSELHQSQLHIASLQNIPQICLNFNDEDALGQELGEIKHNNNDFSSHPNENDTGKESQSNMLSQFLDYGQRSRRCYERPHREIQPMSDTNVTNRYKSQKSNGSRRKSGECNLRIGSDVMPYDPGIRSASQPLDTDKIHRSNRAHSGHRHRSRVSDFDSHRRPRKPNNDESRHRKSKSKIECTNCRQPISSDHGTLPGESYCSDASTCRSVSPPLTLRRRDSGVTLGVVLVKSSTSQKVKRHRDGGSTVLDFS